eukprot:1375898-Amphidinium_carterae.2
MQQGRRHPKGRNCDLEERVLLALPRAFRIRWMKAHQLRLQLIAARLPPMIIMAMVKLIPWPTKRATFGNTVFHSWGLVGPQLRVWPASDPRVRLPAEVPAGASDSDDVVVPIPPCVCGPHEDCGRQTGMVKAPKARSTGLEGALRSGGTTGGSSSSFQPLEPSQSRLSSAVSNSTDT